MEKHNKTPCGRLMLRLVGGWAAAARMMLIMLILWSLLSFLLLLYVGPGRLWRTNNTYSKSIIHSSSSTLSAPPLVSMGFDKEIVQAGDGPKPVKGQTVTVHCTGYGKNGDLSVPFWR